MKPSISHIIFCWQGCREPTFECQGLTPNAEYHFRVAAANANGVGPFIETANTTVAKLPFGKLCNNMEQLYEIFQE